VNNPLIGAALVLDVVVAPAAGCARVLRAPRALGPLVLLGVAAAAIHITSMVVIEPAVRADALIADTLGGPGDATGLFRAAQVGVALFAPFGILVRSGLLSLMFDATAAVLGRGRTGRSLWVWLVGIEIVPLLEQTAGLAALALDPPASLDAMPAHELHAGIGLVYDFASPALAAVADAATAFTIWWGALLALGLIRVARFRSGTAIGLAAACWLGVVAIRTISALR